MKLYFSLCVTILSAASAARSKRRSTMHGILDELPNTGREWVTLDNGIEFQPGSDLDPRLEHARELWGQTESSTSFQDDNPFGKIFVDGTETYYDEYSQAWRYLGFYIDCDAVPTCNNDDDLEEDCDERRLDGEGCMRFLMWAAVSNIMYKRIPWGK
jgi:hypothetical protein